MIPVIGMWNIRMIHFTYIKGKEKAIIKQVDIPTEEKSCKLFLMPDVLYLHQILRSNLSIGLLWCQSRQNILSSNLPFYIIFIYFLRKCFNDWMVQNTCVPRIIIFETWRFMVRVGGGRGLRLFGVANKSRKILNYTIIE